jgi:chitinase
MELKTKNRGMKTLISIGGWSYTHEKNTLQTAAQTPEGRATFINAILDIVKNMGFDGVDIDWEYPTSDAEATNYVLLLKELRAALDAYAQKSAQGYHFLITVASPAGATQYNQMHLKEMDQYIDSWHLMAYDFSGDWAPATGHISNLYPSSDPNTTPFSADNAIKAYITAGILAEKIVFGMPLYGRGFSGTTGMGQPHAHSGPYTPEYSILPKPGAVEHYDADLVATYSFDQATRELIAYQGMNETHAKARYIKDKGLGGSMWWVAGADKDGNDSLVYNMVKDLGSIENSTNLLHYPESTYPFIRDVQPVQEQKQQSKPVEIKPAERKPVAKPVEVKGKGRDKGKETKEDPGLVLFALGKLLGVW